jgi:hypothetical protein
VCQQIANRRRDPVKEQLPQAQLVDGDFADAQLRASQPPCPAQRDAQLFLTEDRLELGQHLLD